MNELRIKKLSEYMTTTSFFGTGVALVTPFKKDHSIDFEALEQIVNHVIENGVDYLVALGTTSEAPVMNENEKSEVLNTIIKANSGRVPTVLGIGGNNTDSIVKQIEQTSFNNISGILSVTPYYNKPGQSGLFAHYDLIAKTSPVPVILYNVPGRTGVNMKPTTTLELANAHSNIVAVKEASGDVLQIMEIIAQKPSHFEVISGDDALTLPLIALGAKGVISVAANAFTKAFTSMVHAQLSNDNEQAKALHYKMLKLIDLLFVEGNPAGVKAVMKEMKLCEDVVRLPLMPASEQLRLQIAKQLAIF